MAHYEIESTGTLRFGWQDPITRQPKRIRMGRMAKKEADKVAGFIQDIADASKTGMPAPPQAQSWLLHLPTDTHAKLSLAGLVPARRARTLVAFCQDVIERKRGSVADPTLYHYTLATKSAGKFFGADRDIATITTGEAVEFNRHLRQARTKISPKTGKEIIVPGLKEGTANKRCETLCVIFHEAKRWKLIEENPFADRAVPKMSKPAPEEKRVFIEEDVARRILDELAHPEMKALFAFARWCGTRQTEPLKMTWEQVHFGDGTPEDPGYVLIPCDKTVSKTGKAWRKCPLFREVEQTLLVLKADAREGSTNLFPCYRFQGNNASTSALKKAMKRAGVNYPAPWQNLRRTRATELKERHPEFAVEEWMGHTEEVANQHYRRASNKMLAAAIGYGRAPRAAA